MPIAQEYLLWLRVANGLEEFKGHEDTRHLPNSKPNLPKGAYSTWWQVWWALLSPPEMYGSGSRHPLWETWEPAVHVLRTLLSGTGGIRARTRFRRGQFCILCSWGKPDICQLQALIHLMMPVPPEGTAGRNSLPCLGQPGGLPGDPPVGAPGSPSFWVGRGWVPGVDSGGNNKVLIIL